MKYTVLIDDVIKGDAGLKGTTIIINQLVGTTDYEFDGSQLVGDVFPCSYLAKENAIFFLVSDANGYKNYNPHLKVNVNWEDVTNNFPWLKT